MSAKLNVSVEERLTDPERWHPRMRRGVQEWAEAKVFWRRGPVSHPTRDARRLRPVPPAAIRALTGKVAA